MVDESISSSNGAVKKDSIENDDTMYGVNSTKKLRVSTDSVASVWLL